LDPLGFCNICLKSDDLDRTVAFYRDLGFAATGEDAPGLRISLANGPDVLTFMSFLKRNVINFRGGHVHRLMRQLEEVPIHVSGHNEHADEQPLMLDDRGEPLPENECGHFTVHDPDGHELFFNTHPEERGPFENAIRAAPGGGAGPPRGLLGRFVYCLHVADLRASRSFYESLGLAVMPISGGAWVVPPAHWGAARFAMQLRESGTTEEVLRFFGVRDRIGLGARGFSEHDDGWRGEDPDGRTLELVGVRDPSIP